MDPVQHFEIPYKVRERAKKFYFQAFGWQLFDVPETGYCFATTVPIEATGMPKRPGAINGGLAPRGKGLTAPTLLVKVADLAAHLTRIEHAGGRILVKPTAMGPVWYARFRDPEGNVMGALQDRPEGQEQVAAVARAAARKGSPAGRGRRRAKPAGRTRAAGRTRKAAAGSGRAAGRTGKAAGGSGKAAGKGARAARSARRPREARPVWSR